MDYKEMVMNARPDLKASGVRNRCEHMERAEKWSNDYLLSRYPRVGDAPEFLDFERFTAPYTFLTYGEISAYFWALEGDEYSSAMKDFLTRRKVVLQSRAPENAEDYILPSYVNKALWCAMMENKVFTFEDFRRPIRVHVRCLDIPAKFRDACRNKGYEVHSTNTVHPWVNLKPAGRRPRFEPYATIGAKIRTMRTMVGESLEDAAKACGVSATWLRRLEAGETASLSVTQLIALAEHYGLSLDVLCSKGIK